LTLSVNHANGLARGGKVLIVTAEFDRWVTAAGVRPHDRLYILGLRNDDTLLIAELKRGQAPNTVEMQARSTPP
jgi:hypothetical protein